MGIVITCGMTSAAKSSIFHCHKLPTLQTSMIVTRLNASFSMGLVITCSMISAAKSTAKSSLFYCHKPPTLQTSMIVTCHFNISFLCSSELYDHTTLCERYQVLVEGFEPPMP